MDALNHPLPSFQPLPLSTSPQRLKMELENTERLIGAQTQFLRQRISMLHTGTSPLGTTALKNWLKTVESTTLDMQRLVLRLSSTLKYKEHLLMIVQRQEEQAT